MIKVEITGVHQFVKTHDFTKSDRLESYDAYRCTRCGLLGRRLSNRDSFILVSDTFSETRIQKCQRDDFFDKYAGREIQTVRAIKAAVKIPAYSVHKIISAPKGQVNGERGIWVNVDGKYFKILDDEYIFYPLPPRKQELIPTLKKHNKPLPFETTIHTVRTRTISPAKRTRTVAPVQVKRTRTTPAVKPIAKRTR